jgi:hypothetical protein
MYRVFIPGGIAVIYTEFYQVKNPAKPSRVFCRFPSMFLASLIPCFYPFI